MAQRRARARTSLRMGRPRVAAPPSPLRRAMMARFVARFITAGGRDMRVAVAHRGWALCALLRDTAADPC
ncbi:ENTH-domain-containing protein [Dorcoceras hygrometricum]|uniref:ENTH-domain-containing protein n=1 Tax=Dorcoceras hygrometricum TaxID=472368 RepID=A0A2Z6ZRB0_9LAMI|nr:ENTH-domain-containing protein [Dorcoceras hygrometricum]